METSISKERLTEVLRLCSVKGLRDIIATERENGHAFGMVAEACRDELAKRTGDARV